MTVHRKRPTGADDGRADGGDNKCSTEHRQNITT